MTKPIQLKENEILDGLDSTTIDAYNEKTEEDIEYYVPGKLRSKIENFINDMNTSKEHIDYSKYRNFHGIIYDYEREGYFWRYELCINSEFSMETQALTEKELKQLIRFANAIKKEI